MQCRVDFLDVLEGPVVRKYLPPVFKWVWILFSWTDMGDWARLIRGSSSMEIADFNNGPLALR